MRHGDLSPACESAGLRDDASEIGTATDQKYSILLIDLGWFEPLHYWLFAVEKLLTAEVAETSRENAEKSNIDIRDTTTICE
jgi:hypothetical protein